MNKVLSNLILWSLIALGAACCVFAIYFFPYELLDWRFASLSFFTITFGSRLSLQMPRSQVRILMSDALIFLTLLLYGGEMAILLAAAEALSTSFVLWLRGFVKRLIVPPFNAAVMATSTAGTYYVFWLFLKTTNRALHNLNISDFVTLLGAMMLVQFALNTTLIAIGISLTYRTSFWKTWNEKCFAVSIASVAGIFVAGTMFKLIEYFDSYAFVIAALIVTLVYLTYTRYIEAMKESMEQAEKAEQRRLDDAEKHIAELNIHLAEQELISDQLQASKLRFQYAALHDALTGLPNRSYFFDQIKIHIERCKHDANYGFSVLFMDLDRFKNINDSMGHAMGDKVLIEVGKCLEKTVRQDDTVARLGGDEFALVLPNIFQPNDVLAFAERVRDAISKPFLVDEHQVFTGTSIGVSINDHEYSRPEDMLRDADIAMYHAKENKIGCAIFDRELRVKAVNTIQLESDLRHAVERLEFRLFLQPIVSLENGSLVGFEALIRWQHPERGMISPADFIPIAENTGQIVPMTNWILWQACSQLSRWRWRSAANRSLLVSVNLSGKHLSQSDIIAQVKQTLNDTGLDARCLKLELTESAVMENAEETIKLLKSLRETGVQLSIDDFGTGYSSLSYLHRFPINTLKVDRSFVSRMGADEESSEIVKTIVTLAHNLNLDVIAEGVETIEQLEKLRSFGCRYAQGYLFAKPMPQEEMDKVLTRTNWLPEGIPVLPTKPSVAVVALHNLKHADSIAGAPQLIS
jgi:diguanylate cyclase (GGDEF)-like protein